MKRFVVTVILVLIPFTVFAQNWTAEQKEVIEHIKGCWDAWKEAFIKKDLQIWLDACPCIEDFADWNTEDGAPAIGLAAEKRGLNMGLYSMIFGEKGDWLDLRPISVKIDGDVALVHFYAIFIWENTKGEAKHIQQKRFEVFRRKAERWTLIGGMTTPVSQGITRGGLPVE